VNLYIAWCVVGVCIFVCLLPLKPLSKINLWRALLVSIPLGPGAILCALTFLLVRGLVSLASKLTPYKKITEWLTK